MAAGRGTAEQVYDAAAAEHAPAERRASPPGCAATAWRSWTRSPSDIAPALADAYLALKAAGRL